MKIGYNQKMEIFLNIKSQKLGLFVKSTSRKVKDNVSQHFLCYFWFSRRFARKKISIESLGLTALYELMSAIFAYGTLRNAQVRKALLNKDLTVIDNVVLNGSEFSIHPVLPHRRYPALIKHKSSNNNRIPVIGTLILGVTQEDFEILELFEDEYVHERVQIQAENIPSEVPIHATAYLWNSPISLVDLDNTWSYADFAEDQNGLESFVANTAEFRASILNQHKKESI